MRNNINYPNLELLEYQFIQEIAKRYKLKNPKITAEMFLQMWGSTATAFDICDDGSPAIGGCAMTEAYTVIFHERNSDIYGIFVDNKPCYLVTNPSEKFLEDIKNKNIASKSEANQIY